MIQQEFSSYRFSSGQEPSDEILNRLMENVARKVRKSNQEANSRYFENLRRECEAVRTKKSDFSSQQSSESL